MADWARVGKAVAERRRSLRLSQRVASDIADISPTTWQSLEKHHRPVNGLTEAAICQALGWTSDSIQRLLNGDLPIIADEIDSLMNAMDQTILRADQAVGRMIDTDELQGLAAPEYQRRLRQLTLKAIQERLDVHGDVLLHDRDRMDLLLRRMDELLLRVEDIDRNAMTLRVLGKGNKEGVVPMHPAVLRALVAYGLPGHGFVFTKQSGTDQPLSPSTISRYIGRYLESLGSSGRAHATRHFFASSIYRQTGDLLVTRDLLRHRSVATSEGYTALVVERGRDAVLMLDGPDL